MALPPVHIHAVSTLVPAWDYRQEEVGRVLRQALEPGGRGDRLSQRIYRHSGIETRHSVISGYRPGEGDGLFFDRSSGEFLSPSTGDRNEKYVLAARPLFIEAARRALESSPFSPEEVTHIVTASCTGFFAPGPDYHILKALALPASVERYHVGFMGCFAAFPALRMAKSFCQTRPDAVVLVVCLELCTLHLEPSEEIDNIIASSVFADGAAGVVVSARRPESARLVIEDSVTHLAPDSEDDMAWKIGDRGFEMVLSTYVPRILGARIEEIVDGLLARTGRSRDDIEHWWVHPGGRAILDHVQEALTLGEDDLEPSRTVLARYGNMSSATILFVLKEALESGSVRPGDLAYAMAFGPGLTVESALLTGV